MLEIRKQCNCPDLPRDVDPQAAAQHMRRCVANVRKRKELLADLQKETSLLDKISDTSSKNTSRSDIDEGSLQKSKDKLENIQLQIKELETEYQMLVGTPRSEQEEIVKEGKEGVFRQLWEKISGKIAVSGKLNDTLFDNEKVSSPRTTMQPVMVQASKS